jgi:YHS domain-containing protein
MINSNQPQEESVSKKGFTTLCGRVLENTDPAYFPRAKYKRDVTIYLCTESCLGAFTANPELFYKAHKKRSQQMSRNTTS